MRFMTILLCYLLYALISPSVSGADVKIFLKNGRDIVADSCRDAGDRMICNKIGGSFEVNKKDIGRISEIAPEETAGPVVEPAAEPAEEAGKKEAGTEAAALKAPAAGEAGVPAQGVSPEARKRLEEIYTKKLEMKVEREKLILDRDQLHEDVKNAGVVRSQERLDSFKNRITDLDTKIRKFNEDVELLNKEETTLIQGPKQ